MINKKTPEHGSGVLLFVKVGAVIITANASFQAYFFKYITSFTSFTVRGTSGR